FENDRGENCTRINLMDDITFKERLDNHGQEYGQEYYNKYCPKKQLSSKGLNLSYTTRDVLNHGSELKNPY
ncbi:hypothetical protein PIB30_066373, partial [Stylosanthes scabra]|nr:hypothetical protein [Stylosanthes scabra]